LLKVINMKVRIGPYRKNRAVNIEIEPFDTWSMDRTLALIILPMLKQLKDTKHGAPYVDSEDVPRELRPGGEELRAYNRDGTTDEHFFERWDWALDEMIFAFDSKVNDGWEEQFETGTSDIQWKTLEGGMCEMIRGPNDTKEYDLEGRKKYEERISNGFRLFGKYYSSLWD